MDFNGQEKLAIKKAVMLYYFVDATDIGGSENVIEVDNFESEIDLERSVPHHAIVELRF